MQILNVVFGEDFVERSIYTHIDGLFWRRKDIAYTRDMILEGNYIPVVPDL